MTLKIHGFVSNKLGIQKYMGNSEATHKLAANNFHSGGSPGYVYVGWVDIFYLFLSLLSFQFILCSFYFRLIPDRFWGSSAA